MKAIIKVGLKPGVLDPQGRAIARGLNDLGYKGVKDARQGKIIELDLTTEDKAVAEQDVKEMCEKLLANTVIESFDIRIED